MTLDLKSLTNIPKAASTGIKWVSDRKRESSIPRADRAMSFSFSWFCIPETIVEGFDNPRQEQFGIPKEGRQFTMAAYCGAPPGIRCACGAQLHGHDPGDEDHKENGIR